MVATCFCTLQIVARWTGSITWPTGYNIWYSCQAKRGDVALPTLLPVIQLTKQTVSFAAHSPALKRSERSHRSIPWKKGHTALAYCILPAGSKCMSCSTPCVPTPSRQSLRHGTSSRRLDIPENQKNKEEKRQGLIPRQIPRGYISSPLVDVPHRLFLPSYFLPKHLTVVSDVPTIFSKMHSFVSALIATALATLSCAAPIDLPASLPVNVPSVPVPPTNPVSAPLAAVANPSPGQVDTVTDTVHLRDATPSVAVIFNDIFTQVQPNTEQLSMLTQ